MPPSLHDWLPEDDLAWFVLVAVEQMDLSAFYGDYCADGYGRAAHEPAMMLALLLYGYAKGQRSSRVIERECVEDIAYRVIAANQRPDHTTIVRFRKRHEQALAGVFSEVLSLCCEAGLLDSGVVVVDSTKLHANPSRDQTTDYERIAKEILAEADAVDREEDERYGEARGDELPPHLSTRGGREAWLPTQGAAMRSAAHRRRGPYRTRALSACATGSDASRRISRSSAARARPMRTTARAE